MTVSLDRMYGLTVRIKKGRMDGWKMDRRMDEHDRRLDGWTGCMD